MKYDVPQETESYKRNFYKMIQIPGNKCLNIKIL